MSRAGVDVDDDKIRNATRLLQEAKKLPLPPKILFTSYHGVIDPTSGAAICTWDLLGWLLGLGWQTRVLCGPMLDFPRQEIAELLQDQGLEFRRREHQVGGVDFALYHFREPGMAPEESRGGIVYQPAMQGERGLPGEEAGPFLTLYRRMLEREQPDVVLTYGGPWFAPEMMRLARQMGIAVVFALHNFAYDDARLFEHVDAVRVPSRFSAQWYRERLGIESTAIASSIDWDRVICDRDADKQYVTFVNPHPTKGVFVFARIALELGRRRPDIPLLVVEGRGEAQHWLERTGLDLSGVRNLHRMANTPDPRDFYRATHLLLMPSLWNESFGRVAAEAMLNGIPVIASDRGALPEVVGDAGVLLNIPARYTPESRQVPTAEEVQPWVEAIIDLWDNDPRYTKTSRACQAAAQAWRAEKIAAEYDQFFRKVIAEVQARSFLLPSER